jgi:TolB-like protein/DNA-binding winged helix-turn-helix (wHTH) protein
MANNNKAFEFGPFRLEVRERRLTRDGHPVPLRGGVFDTLYALVSRHGCLVTKDELMAIIWPDSIVEESNLNHNICVLRRALGERVTGQKYVETIPRQGYRFVAEVKELEASAGYTSSHGWGMPRLVPPAIHPPSESQSEAETTEIRQSLPRAAGRPRYSPQQIVLLLAISVLLIAGYFGVAHRGFRKGPSDSRVMLAVLPFENLTGDSTQDYVSEGLNHEIISQLGRWNSTKLGVISRTSSNTYRGTVKPVSEIGRELGVNYIVEGSMRGNGSHFRITVMLIRVDNQTPLWAANYDRDAGNVIAFQVEVTQAIIREIGSRIAVEPAEGSLRAYPARIETGGTASGSRQRPARKPFSSRAD